MTAEQMDMISAMTGPEFDQMWLEMMIARHEGATSHSEAVKAEGSNADVLTLADQIITAGKAKSPKCKPSSRAGHHSPIASTPMSTGSTSRPTFTAGASQFVPAHLTGLQWPDGTVECRFRLTHPAGSLVAANGEVGVILTDPDAACTVCSDACAG